MVKDIAYKIRKYEKKLLQNGGNEIYRFKVDSYKKLLNHLYGGDGKELEGKYNVGDVIDMKKDTVRMHGSSVKFLKRMEMDLIEYEKSFNVDMHRAVIVEKRKFEDGEDGYKVKPIYKLVANSDRSKDIGWFDEEDLDYASNIPVSVPIPVSVSTQGWGEWFGSFF